jgi:hypothetical protein
MYVSDCIFECILTVSNLNVSATFVQIESAFNGGKHECFYSEKITSTRFNPRGRHLQQQPQRLEEVQGRRRILT